MFILTKANEYNNQSLIFYLKKILCLSILIFLITYNKIVNTKSSIFCIFNKNNNSDQ